MANNFYIQIGWMTVQATGLSGMLGVSLFVAVLLLLPVFKAWIKKRLL